MVRHTQAIRNLCLRFQAVAPAGMQKGSCEQAKLAHQPSASGTLPKQFLGALQLITLHTAPPNPSVTTKDASQSDPAGLQHSMCHTGLPTTQGKFRGS